MIRKAVSGITLILILIGMLTVAFDTQPGEAEHGFQLLLYTDKDTYILEENVTIIVENIGNETVDWAGVCPVPWDIYTYPDEKRVFEAVACYCAFQLAPGENVTYVWNQSDQFTVSPVEPGMYVVRDNQGWGLSTYFKIIAAEIVVPDDYPTIQEAINHAHEGDTIFVLSGTYYENVVVNKTVSLIGESRTNTVVDAERAATVFNVTANNVKITEFTIQNNDIAPGLQGAILLYYSSGNNISGNILKDNSYICIRLAKSNYNTIKGNTITNSAFGILVEKGSTRNNIVNNSISNIWHGWGIILDHAPGNTLSSNVISNYTYHHFAIEILHSGNTTLKHNQLIDNLYNLYVRGNLLDYLNDIDDSNTVNGKPVYYWVNQHNRQVPADAGYVAAVKSTNITVKNLDLAYNGQGVIFHHTTNSVIENVNASKNLYGVSVRFSSGNTIRGNILSENKNSGIELFGYSDNNRISNNTLISNEYGISLFLSSGNNIYHNNFVCNTIQVTNTESNNTWYDGYPSGGNYWSDYNGTDFFSGPYQNKSGSDGIGDTPYFIDENNRDNYPLMSPYEYWSNPILGDINRDMKVDHKDLFTLAAAYGSTPDKSNWNPYADVNNDGRVDHKDLFILASNYGKEWKYP